MSYYTLLLVLMVAAMAAQWYMSVTYGRFSRIRNARNLTGAEVARDILDSNGLNSVVVERISGQLNDHYDPIHKVVRLSDANYSQPSLAALAVAAHECGHAVQDARGFAPLRIRADLFPVLSFGSNIGPYLIIGGLLLNLAPVAWLGVLTFSGAILFHLITLPVEFDASNRALATLRTNGYLAPAELSGAQTVLTAAALTYLVGFLIAVAQLLYWVSLLTGNRRG